MREDGSRDTKPSLVLNDSKGVQHYVVPKCVMGKRRKEKCRAILFI